MAAIAFLVPAAAQANLIYTYTGSTAIFTQGVYQAGVDRITGSFILSDDFILGLDPDRGVGPSDVTSGVVSYSFTDGHQTLTSTNSTASFMVGFLADGTAVTPGEQGSLPYWWSFSIATPTTQMSANFINREWSMSASLDPNQEIQICPDGRLCFSDPTHSGMLINSNFRADEIGGTAGTWTVQRVPEPATLILSALGIGIVMRRRRRIK
jgi:hypothetical protein